MKKITILVPAYNEEGNLEHFHDELSKLLSNPCDIQLQEENSNNSTSKTIEWTFKPSDFEWEFLFVNDGSKDNTLGVLRKLRKLDPRVHFVNLSRNFGKENAMLAGMDYASGDALIIMDADLQHPVNLIPEFLYWWEKGFDDVYAKRASRGKESWLRKKLSLSFYNLLQHSTRIEILPNVGDFRLIDRRVVDAIRKMRETQRYTKGLFCWVGYNKKETLYHQADRMSGVSSFRLSSLINLAIDGITTFTTTPLRISTIIGFVVSFFSLIYLIFIFVKTLIYGDPVQGFPTLLCAILFIGGVQLIAIGIIGEYIGRIFNETKMRPVYIAESFDDDKIA